MPCCDDRSAPKVANWRLYHLLDLVPPVSTLAVKYTSSRATLRTQFQQAYWTLAERNRKFFYDLGGEGAFDMLSSSTWGALVSFFGLRLYAFLFFIVGLILTGLLATFFILVALRADGFINISWQRVAVPLLVFFCLLPLIVITAAFTSFTSFFVSELPLRLASLWDRLAPIGYVLSSVAYLISSILLFMTLASTDTMLDAVGSYTFYLIPVMVGDSVYYLTSLTWRWPSVMKRKMKLVGGIPPTRVVYHGTVVLGVLHWMCCICQWVIIGCRLDERVRWSWYVVAIPLGIRGLLCVIDTVLRTLTRHYQQVRGTPGMLFDMLGSLFIFGSLVISVYWVAVWLEEHIFILSMWVALIPVYMVLAYIIIGLFVTCFVTECAVTNLELEEKRLQFLWSPSEKDSPDKSVEWDADGEGRGVGYGEIRAPVTVTVKEEKRRIEKMVGMNHHSDPSPFSGTANACQLPALSATEKKSSSFPSQLEASSDRSLERVSDSRRGGQTLGQQQQNYSSKCTTPSPSSLVTPSIRSEGTKENLFAKTEEDGEEEEELQHLAKRRTATPPRGKDRNKVKHKRRRQRRSIPPSDVSSSLSSFTFSSDDEEEGNTWSSLGNSKISSSSNEGDTSSSDSSYTDFTSFSDEETQITGAKPERSRGKLPAKERRKDKKGGGRRIKRREDSSENSKESGSYVIHRSTTSSMQDSGNGVYTTTTTVSVRLLSSEYSDDEEEEDTSYSYEYMSSGSKCNGREHDQWKKGKRSGKELVEYVQPKSRRTRKTRVGSI